jgi:hypothetical protein
MHVEYAPKSVENFIKKDKLSNEDKYSSDLPPC